MNYLDLAKCIYASIGARVISGQVCKIIIEGNALIGAAQAVCELGGASYDGAEVMTDEQRTFIASLMQKQVHDLRAFLRQFLPTGDDA